MSMKLLYVSCGHPLLEADDCLTWNKLGLDWFSTGYYMDQEKPGVLPRIPHKINTYLIEELQKCTRSVDELSSSNILSKRYQQYTSIQNNVKNQIRFTTEFFTNFDIVIFNYDVWNIMNNLRAMDESGIRVVLKLFGLHPGKWEKEILDVRKSKNVCVVRTSNNEHLRLRDVNIKFGGYDAIIKQSIIPNKHIMSGWNGHKLQTLTMVNNFNAKIDNIQQRREYYCDIHSMINDYYPMLLHGAGNDDEPLAGKFITEFQKRKLLRDSRVCLCVGTPNANITYSFIEAFVMGTPIVAFSKKLWQGEPYEIDQIIDHGINGFIVKSPQEAAYYITQLMEDDELAQTISANARKKAISIFGRDVIAQKWKAILNDETLGKQKQRPNKKNRQRNIQKIR